MKNVTLKVKCPHCSESLMDKNMMINNEESIRLYIKNDYGKGLLWLSSIYDDFSHSSNLEMDDGKSVEMFCPECDEKLTRDEQCELCSSPIASFNCSIGGKVSICSNNGCKNHYIVFDSIDTVIQKFYNKYEG